MFQKSTIIASGALALAGCALLNRIPDASNKAERDYPRDELYVRVSDDELEGGEKGGEFYKRTESFDARKDIPDVFEKATSSSWFSEADIKTTGGTPLYVRGSRYFVADAWAYCRNMEEQSARASGWWAGIGLPAAAIGVPAAAAGTTLTVAEAAKDDPRSGALAARMSLAAGGYLLSFLGVYALNRSSDAAYASATASAGMKEDKPSRAFKKCIDARANWLSSRPKANNAVLVEIRRAQKRFDAASGIRTGPGDGGAGGSDADNAGGAGGMGGSD